jgi:hypothetical protein
LHHGIHEIVAKREHAHIVKDSTTFFYDELSLHLSEALIEPLSRAPPDGRPFKFARQNGLPGSSEFLGFLVVRARVVAQPLCCGVQNLHWKILLESLDGLVGPFIDHGPAILTKFGWEFAPGPPCRV